MEEGNSSCALLNGILWNRGYRNTGDALVCRQVFVNKLILVKATESTTAKPNEEEKMN